jgi:predicted nucleotidyltransferase
MNSFGLRDSDINYIVQLMKENPQVDQAILFGSRAMGNFKQGSDVDIALIGDGIDLNTVAHIRYLLEEESPMPYLFDVFDYTHSNHDELKKHVQEFGNIIYNR